MFGPFDAPYMQSALLAGLLLAVPCGLLGVWVVLRGLAFFSHAVGVATFPGVVLGLGLPAIGPFAGSLAAAGAFGVAVSSVETDHRVRGGAVTGLALAAAMATGAVLLTTVAHVSTPVETVLFGSLLGISDTDVARCAVVAVTALGAMALLWTRLEASTFDRAWAEPAGARASRTDVLLLILIGFTVVTALPAVGSLMVSGLLVIPAATARLLCDRLVAMSACAVALCAAEVVIGLALARELDVAPGASIAALGGLGFALAAAVSAARSALVRRAPAT